MIFILFSPVHSQKAGKAAQPTWWAEEASHSGPQGPQHGCYPQRATETLQVTVTGGSLQKQI